MPEQRSRFPYALPIIAVVLIILGLAAGPVISSLATPQQMTRNIFLNAAPFIMVFVGILLLYITLIVIVGRRYNDRIDPHIHHTIERVLIGGIVFGILGMFQPWFFILYRIGFILLLFSTFSFILWSHVRPRREQIDEVAVAVSPTAPH
jgi:hypothetical protein